MQCVVLHHSSTSKGTMGLPYASIKSIVLPLALSRNGDADNLDILLRLLLVYLGVLDFVNNIHACNRSSKDGMLVVEPGLHVRHSQRAASPSD
jgi:hypothetical protein